VSLQNNNPGFNLEYWAYNNEFVGSTPLVNTDVLTRPTPGEQIMMYRTGTLNPPVSVPGEVVYIPQCNNDLPNVYPLRMAVEQNINSFTSIQRSENYAVQNAHLGEAFPNPATSQVTFQVFIPEQSDKDYQLSIFDLNGKKVLSQITIMVKGAANVEMPLLSLQAGVYGYSLSENGRTLGTRKLVIIKKL
jgi:hypothetical protein